MLIDLVSDTATRPSPEMRRFMAEAPVGDEQRKEDPTVNRLQDMAAELLGKEAALYLPSATMANQISYKVHTRPGDEIIIHRDSHPLHFEGGGPALLSGASIFPLDGYRGIFDADQVKAAVRPDDPHHPKTRLVSVENTHNTGGGSIWPVDKLKAVYETAKSIGLMVHMDGARLMNASVASGIPTSEYTSYTDSVMICLSKGLGAPVGAVLAGSAEFIKEARRFKHVFGGAMRQAGIIAAGGVYALEHNVERLAEDHENAKVLAQGLAGITGIELVYEPETNIVFFDVAGLGMSSADFASRALEHGVRFGPRPGTQLRAVTHLDVSREGIIKAIEAARDAAQQH